MVAGIFTRCRRIYKKMQKIKRIKKFYTDYFTFMEEVEPWSRVRMDYAYITGVGPLILVDSFSGWPEVICVPDNINLWLGKN